MKYFYLRSGDKDTLLDQNLSQAPLIPARPCPGVCLPRAQILTSRSSKLPYPQYPMALVIQSGLSFSTIPVVSGPPGLTSAWMVLGQWSQTSHLLWCFFLEIFYPWPWPWTPTLPCIWSWPNLPPLHLLAVVPMLIAMVLNSLPSCLKQVSWVIS